MIGNVNISQFSQTSNPSTLPQVSTPPMRGYMEDGVFIALSGNNQTVFGESKFSQASTQSKGSNSSTGQIPVTSSQSSIFPNQFNPPPTQHTPIQSNDLFSPQARLTVVNISGNIVYVEAMEPVYSTNAQEPDYRFSMHRIPLANIPQVLKQQVNAIFQNAAVQNGSNQKRNFVSQPTSNSQHFQNSSFPNQTQSTSKNSQDEQFASERQTSSDVIFRYY